MEQFLDPRAAQLPKIQASRAMVRLHDDGESHDRIIKKSDLASGIICGTGVELARFQLRLAQIVDQIDRGDRAGTQAMLRQEIGFIRTVLLATSSDLLRLLQDLVFSDTDATVSAELESA